jgi:class 3 adenylate cyclase/pimeloyl-ACP methyl ester carboxylesterase
MQPKIQFTTTSDGLRIAYTRLGAGPPVLINRVPAIGFVAELEMGPTLASLLAQAATVTVFDHAGSGASQREGAGVSLDCQVRALESVAATIESERFALLAGGPQACASAVAFAVRQPELVSHLICIRPSASDPVKWSIDFLRDNWSMSRRFMTDDAYPDASPELRRRYSRALADSVEHEFFYRYAEEARRIDLPALYRQVQVPTLLIERLRDDAARARLQPILDALPGCRLVIEPESWTRLDRLQNEIDPALEFMGIETRPRTGPAPAETAIILFADVVDSTAMAGRLGNAAFRERTRELEQALRSEIRQAGGAPVEGRTLGDGVLGVFSSAARAIDAALLCSPHAERLGLQLHLGIHAGDVIHEAGNVSGQAVSVAARISDLTEPNEIFVSSTVRDLARASTDVVFEDRGEHALKGVAEPQRVYAVRHGA